MNKKSVSMQRISMALPKPSSPTKRTGRLQFPIHGDSSIFAGVGKKHLAYTNQTTLDKLNILELDSLRQSYARERKMTMPESYQMLSETLPIKKEPKPANTNPQDSLSLMEKQYSSKQLMPSQLVLPEPVAPKIAEPQRTSHHFVEPLQQQLINQESRQSLRVNSLPHMSPMSSQKTPLSRYNIYDMRRFNPTYLSSAIQLDSKLPVFML